LNLLGPKDQRYLYRDLRSEEHIFAHEAWVTNSRIIMTGHNYWLEFDRKTQMV